MAWLMPKERSGGLISLLRTERPLIEGGRDMFETVLYPTDFSDVSKKALAAIKELKASGARNVLILHVIDEHVLSAVRASRLVKPDAWEKNMRETVERDMGTIEKELREVGFQVRTMVKTGVPLREILEAEKQENVSLIVIGSHGKSNLEEVLIGSVSEKVIRRCTKPILVVKR